MIITAKRRGGAQARFRAISVLLVFQVALGPVASVASALPVETQDSVTEIITTRLAFDGADGSTYSATRVGPFGAQLGDVTQSLTFGRGAWGASALYDNVRILYPGNLTLGASGEANEIFFNRQAFSGRDMDAAGNFVWNTGTTNSVVVGAFDADGDGLRDDAFMANSSNVNRITTWNQAGTQIGTRRLGSNLPLNDALAVDANADGRLEQIAVAHEGGLVYLEPANIAADVWVYNLPGTGTFAARMLTAADFDNDTFLENVVVGSEDNGVYALSPAGTQLWAYNAGAGALLDIAPYWPSGSAAQNGVLVAASDAITALNWNGQVIWNYSTNATVTTLAPADIDGDRLRDDAVYGDASGGITVLDEMGQAIAFTDFLAGPIIDIAAADLAGTGRPGQFVAVNGSNLVGLDDTLALRWAFIFPATALANAVVAADFDGNGMLGDSLVGTSTTVYAVNSAGSERWNYSGPYNTTRLAFIENPRFASGGNYESEPVDAQIDAAWADLTAGYSVNSANEALAASVRFGSGIPSSISWGPWQGPASPALWNLSGNVSRFVQVRYTFNSSDNLNAANLSWFRVNYTSPALTGFVETPDFAPSPAPQWIDFSALRNETGGALRFYYSSNGGASWQSVLPGGAIDAGNTSAPALRIRIEMDAGSGTPTVGWVALRYAQPGLVPAIVRPAASQTITGTYNISATADGAITSLSFEYKPANQSGTTVIGSAQWDPDTSTWWFLWDTSSLNLTGAEVWARGVDARGFTFTAKVAPIDIDNAPPTISVAQPVPFENVTGVYAVWALTSTDAVSVTVSYYDGVVVHPLGMAAETTPGLWSLVWNTTGLGTAEGGRLTAAATDAAGLLSTAEVTPVTVDNTPPWVNISGPAPGFTFVGDGRVNITGSADIARVQVSVNNRSAKEATPVAVIGNESTWQLDIDTHLETYNNTTWLQVVARDRVNLTASNTSGPYTVDNTQPIPTLVSPALNRAYTGSIHLAASAPPQTARVSFFYLPASEVLPRFIKQIEASERNSTTQLFEFDWDTRSPKVDFNGTLVVVATSFANITGLWPRPPGSWIEVDNTGPIIQFTAPQIGEVRLTGLYAVEAIASADVVSVSFSYQNQSSGQVTPVGSMTRISASDWRYNWDLTNVRVPSATLRMAAVDQVGFQAWANFTDVAIGIIPGDDPPVIVRPPTNVFLDEDFGTYVLNLTGLVVDDDLPNITAAIDGVDPRVVTLRNNGSLGLQPIFFISVADAYTSLQTQLTLRVTDRSGQTASSSFGFLITPRNDPPQWRDAPENIYVRYDTPYELDFFQYTYDVEHLAEGGPLFISTTDGTHISANASNPLSLIFNYPASLANTSQVVEFSLSDGDSQMAPATYSARIYITNDWVPELIAPLPVIVLFEDTPRANVYNLNDYFRDRDNDQMFYTRGFTNISFQIDPDGNVSVTALPADWSGNQTVFFRAQDTHEAFSESRAVFTVLPVNDAPRWDFSSGLDVTNYSVHFDLDYPVTLTAFLVDVDNAPHELTLISSDPLHAHAAPGQPHTLVFNFPASLNGTIQRVTLQVSDGNLTSEPFTIFVKVNDNYPPALVRPLPQEIVLLEGETRREALDLSDYFTDRDGVLFFAFGGHNITVVIDNVTGMVTLISSGEWNGTEKIVFRAIDDRDAFQDSVVWISVLPVDDPPRIEYIGDKIWYIGQWNYFDLAPFTSDTDTPRSKIMYTVSSIFPGAAVIVVGGNVSVLYPVNTGASGFDTLRVCASDANGTYCRTISVTLLDLSPPPFDFLRFFFFVGAVAVSTVIGARHFFEFKVRRPPTVEDVFLVYEDGILIKHYSKQVRKFADDDVVTSMLSAIQSFAADSFEDTQNWELREISFQGRKILIERADKFQIFVIFDGDSNEDLKKQVRLAAESIARDFNEPLKDWDGDPSHFDLAKNNFSKLLALQRAFVPKDMTVDQLRKAPLIPGNAYVSETGNFDPLLEVYGKELSGVAVIRLRPQGDAGVSLNGLRAQETELVEIADPGSNDEEAEDSFETGLDVAAKALGEALADAKTAVRGRAPLVLFEGMDFVVDRYGFVFSKKFVDQLKRSASREGFYLFMAVNPDNLAPNHLEGLERDSVVLRGEAKNGPSSGREEPDETET